MALFEKTKVYELPLKRDYVSNWTMREAVRELLQNALDHSPDLDYEFERMDKDDAGSGYSLRLCSKNVKLPASCLVLGETSKASDSTKIGAFGEGFKLALLVLTRLGYTVRMLNDGVEWRPGFVHSKSFDTEVFAITETAYPKNSGEGLTYLIHNLSNEDMATIRDSCLQMRDPESFSIFHETAKGTIFSEHGPALYVNGLFVCSTKLKYSYNIKPEYLQLERDRSTVDGFDLQWLTKDMWFATSDWERCAEMIEQQIPDMEYANYNCPELLEKFVYERFKANNPGTIMARTQEDMKRLVENGMTKVVYSGGAWGAAVAAHQPSYGGYLKPEPTAEEILSSFLRQQRSNMRTPAIVAFKALLVESKNWKLTKVN